MRKFFARFAHERRGTVALIFAGSLLPLVMLIGLSIDYSFYIQARSQFALAGDAAAAYALREASAVYEVEVGSATDSNNINAQNVADAAGDLAGQAWFSGQLGTLPTASLSTTSPPSVIVGAVTEQSSSDPQGFTAKVSYTGQYPPFFNNLFHQNSNWTFTGKSWATSQFAYVELLILMDDSSSMLVSADQGLGSNSYGTADGNPVSATDPGTVGTMDLNTVCIPNGDKIGTASGYNGTGINGIGSYADPGDFITWSDVKNLQSYTGVTNANATTKAKCASGNQGSFAPCAFACHSTTHTYSATTGFTYTGGSNTALKAITGSTNYTEDLYGLARQLGVRLKLDVVLQSTETILQDMINGDSVPGQFSVGIYAFNNDACPIVTGATLGSGNYATDGTINLTEATTNLSKALSTVEADDYTYTPSETAFPPTSSDANGGTNFPLSVADLIAGTMQPNPAYANTPNCNTTANQGPLATPSTSTTVGSAPTNPEKDIFIITDGMEDQRDKTLSGSTGSGSSTACGRVLGEMTGVYAEANLTTSACAQAVCEPLKKLGFTVYVLQTSYPAVQVQWYYNGGEATSDPYINKDFSSVASPAGSVEEWNTGYQTTGSGSSTSTTYSPATSSVYSTAPNQQALEACASPGHYYLATNSSAITTAMNDMLKSALYSAVVITQ